ncbi:MAG: hypothetical protein FD176_415 [Rhodospirillaceae bacterium]|nr:MAG: hypothetical protein FD176_415 [Rhodospirillaceae bacterium]
MQTGGAKSDPIYEQVRGNPKFAQLVKRRGRLALLLSAIVLVSYYAFMMVVAFAPQVLAVPLSEGGSLTIGAPIGAAIIIISWLLTGVYSHFANGPFEQLNNDIVRETLK